MIKVLTGEQMKLVDKRAIEDLKIPSLILMENAGRAVFEMVVDIFEQFEAEQESVLVICGKGNNGGDGFVAARHLIQEGIQTSVISIYEEEELSGDALINHNVLKNFTEITYFAEIDMEFLRDMISASTVIIDAVFGTGLSSEIKGDLYEIVQAINEYSEQFIVSVDIPSGIEANTGRVLGTAVIADYTSTFFAPKLGSILYPGADHSGEVIINDIGIPPSLLGNEHNVNLITGHYVCANIPLRVSDSHKGTFGKVLNVAGSFGMTGAAYLSAYASLKTGAGYSLLAIPETLVTEIACLSPDIVCTGLKETPDKTISKEALLQALEKAEECNIILVGPGIGTNPSTIEFLSEFSQKLTDIGIPAIFDADALNCLAILDNFVLPVNSIITPHPRELSRLMKLPVEEILKDRIKAAKDAAEKFNTIVVLKGARTIIAEPDGTVYINPTGNSGLAKAGTGDVLSGMIAGFAAQGKELRDAAILGVYLHGLTGDIASENLSEYSVSASHLLDYISDSIKLVTA